MTLQSEADKPTILNYSLRATRAPDSPEKALCYPPGTLQTTEPHSLPRGDPRSLPKEEFAGKKGLYH